MESPFSCKERRQYEIQAHLEEYKSCRAEVIEQVKLRATAVTVAATFILGLAALGATLATRPVTGTSFQAAADQWVPWLLLATPIFAFTLGMWIVHKDCMIFFLAAYINERLKPRMEELLFVDEPSSAGIWNWDGYRATSTAAGRATLWIRKVSACFPHAILAAASIVSLVALKRLHHRGQAAPSHAQIDVFYVDVGVTVIFAISSLWVGLTCETFRARPISSMVLPFSSAVLEGRRQQDSASRL